MTEALNLQSRVTLSDGNTMPLFGLGVWAANPGQETQDAVSCALEVGYRHIDTASMYGNEQDVGSALNACGVPRNEIFVTTKVWETEQGYEPTLRAFEQSQQKLGLEFVDLYLIHWPVEGQRVDTWQALERLQNEGRVKSIGVSNFSPNHLQEIFESGKQRPTVNQIELSPFLQQRTIADFTRSAGIHLTAYCPLARGERFSHRSLQDIAEQTGKTPAQIMIRWGLQQGQTMIPKSVNPVRIRQNADVFDFTLSDKQMRLLAELDEGFRFCPNPLDQP
ncbi:MAG TPA: aldo/keto reductase [Deltaproteobacteria bacterium]|jgi:diketogulonate reductase-like aldo/keto reductase|nr:aldo/keto reductase [Deltaproteobacteria bacterium]HIF70672.1 aldo/keto reductase [Candidatus Lambdaproteobacteria bacterium]|tara:strand:- start:235 stop:1068 length:834 start_codon:yes stop_codon:yes gene_type:complete